MANNFDVLANLPWIIFAIFFLIVFILFIWAGIVLLTAKEDSQKTEKGRKILLVALWSFFITLLIVLIFYVVTFLLKKWETTPSTSGEFPASPAINFPPPPQFIKLGSYYFTGPYSLKKYNAIKESAIFAILCKKNGNYDIIFIEETAGAQLLKHGKYKCWLENCGQKLKNLYTAVFWTPGERYTIDDRKRIEEELKNQINPSCSF